MSSDAAFYRWGVGSGYGDCYAWTEVRGCQLGQKILENDGSVCLVFHRLHVGMELPVTVPVVQYAVKDTACFHVAAGPPTSLCFRYTHHGEISHPLVGPGGESRVAVFYV